MLLRSRGTERADKQVDRHRWIDADSLVGRRVAKGWTDGQVSTKTGKQVVPSRPNDRPGQILFIIYKIELLYARMCVL